MDGTAFYLLLSWACLAGELPRRWTVALRGMGQGRGGRRGPPTCLSLGPFLLKKSFFLLWKNTYNIKLAILSIFLKCAIQGLPDSPAVKTLRFHCRGHGFHPSLEN